MGVLGALAFLEDLQLFALFVHDGWLDGSSEEVDELSSLGSNDGKFDGIHEGVLDGLPLDGLLLNVGVSDCKLDGFPEVGELDGLLMDELAKFFSKNPFQRHFASSFSSYCREMVDCYGVDVCVLLLENEFSAVIVTT